MVNNIESSHKKKIHDTKDVKKMEKLLENCIKSPSIESNTPYKPSAKYSHKEDVKKRINFSFDSDADKENTNHDNSQRDSGVFNKFCNFDTPNELNENPAENNNITKHQFTAVGTSETKLESEINKILAPNEKFPYSKNKDKFETEFKTRNVNQIVDIEIPEFTDMKHQNEFEGSDSDSLIINRLVPSNVSGVSRSTENMKFDIFREHETPNN